MKKLIFVGLIVFAGWQWYSQSRHEADALEEGDALDVMQESDEAIQPVEPIGPSFNCDGRTHCSQMTSCEEATYFLQHCPGTKMDGNNDGVPCEQQWCK